MIADLLRDTLSALYETGSFRFVGMDCGQLEQERPSVKFPCALVALRSVEVSETSSRLEIDEGTLSVRVAWTYNLSGNHEEVIQGYELIEHVRKALCRRLLGQGYLHLRGIERTSDLFNGTEIWTLTYRFSGHW